MIPPQKVEHVRGLARQTGMSRREIARFTGLSRTSVSAILNGTRPDYEAKGSKRPRAVPRPVRCKTCGALLDLVPCVACRARRKLAKGRGSATEDPRELPILGLELKPAEYERYVQVRRRREGMMNDE